MNQLVDVETPDLVATAADEPSRPPVRCWPVQELIAELAEVERAVARAHTYVPGALTGFNPELLDLFTRERDLVVELRRRRRVNRARRVTAGLRG